MGIHKQEQKPRRLPAEQCEFKCYVCSKAFPNKSNLLKHMFMHAGKGMYTCEFCATGFSNAKELRQHINNHLLNPAGWSEGSESQNTDPSTSTSGDQGADPVPDPDPGSSIEIVSTVEESDPVVLEPELVECVVNTITIGDDSVPISISHAPV